VLSFGWKNGPAAGAGRGFVSVTCSKVHSPLTLPSLSMTAWRLRQHHWPSTPGGVRVRSAVDLRRMRAWTVSLWTSEQALREFLRSPQHRAVVSPFVGKISIEHLGWTTDRFDDPGMWRRALHTFRTAPAESLTGPARRRAS